MNYYKVFYWLTVSDGVKTFFDGASNVFTVLSVVSGIVYVIFSITRGTQIAESKSKSESDDKVDPDIRALQFAKRTSARLFFTMLALCLITWSGYVFIPSKRDCYIIIAGGAVGNFISSDSAAKKLPAEALQLLRDKIREESKSISITGVTDTLAGKSKEQLIEMIQNKK